MSPAKQEQVIAYYLAGWPLSVIACRLGLTLPEVYRAITQRSEEPKMNRLEALAAAREHVQKLIAPPVKPNGYALDGWKAPTPSEVNRMILETAQFLLAGEQAATTLDTSLAITSGQTLSVACALDNFIDQGEIGRVVGGELKALVMEILTAHEVSQ